jgi:hypothetical protein
VLDSASLGYRCTFSIASYITGSIWGVNPDLNHTSIIETSAGSEMSFGLVKLRREHGFIFHKHSNR